MGGFLILKYYLTKLCKNYLLIFVMLYNNNSQTGGKKHDYTRFIK